MYQASPLDLEKMMWFTCNHARGAYFHDDDFPGEDHITHPTFNLTELNFKFGERKYSLLVPMSDATAAMAFYDAYKDSDFETAWKVIYDQVMTDCPLPDRVTKGDHRGYDQEQWYRLLNLLGQEYCYVLKGSPRDMAFTPPDWYVGVHCNDTFYVASSDSEYCPNEHLKRLHYMACEWDADGTRAYCGWRRNWPVPLRSANNFGYRSAYEWVVEEDHRERQAKKQAEEDAKEERKRKRAAMPKKAVPNKLTAEMVAEHRRLCEAMLMTPHTITERGGIQFEGGTFEGVEHGSFRVETAAAIHMYERDGLTLLQGGQLTGVGGARFGQIRDKLYRIRRYREVHRELDHMVKWIDQLSVVEISGKVLEFGMMGPTPNYELDNQGRPVEKDEDAIRLMIDNAINDARAFPEKWKVVVAIDSVFGTVGMALQLVREPDVLQYSTLLVTEANARHSVLTKRLIAEINKLQTV